MHVNIFNVYTESKSDFFLHNDHQERFLQILFSF
jgi:hypothetical protein